MLEIILHPSHPFRLLSILAACLACCAGMRPAVADDADTPVFSFSGFGTIGMAHSSERNADFTSTPFKEGGAGASGSWSPDVDSVLAAQLTATLTPKLSALLQVVSEQNYDGTYRPHIEWANVRYEFTPDFSVRIGRTALPLFMMTETHAVGYSNPWVRPPLAVYGLSPITSNDGIDASYRFHLGSAINTVQVTAGGYEVKFPVGVGHSASVQAEGLVGVSDTLEYGAFTARANYTQARNTIRLFDPLIDGFRAFGPEGEAIADRYGISDRRTHFFGVGASYDPGRFFAMGEWGRIETHSIVGDSTGWYVSGGYCLRQFTPYATYSSVRLDSATSDRGLDVGALPPSLALPASWLNAALNIALASRPAASTISLGGRWDLRKNMALSVQFDRNRNAPGSPGALTDLQPGFRTGGRYTLTSAKLDFVF